MYQLTYRSGSLLGLKEQHLQQILEEARTNNRRENITGCLVYYKDSFVQILEGDKMRVLRLYGKMTYRQNLQAPYYRSGPRFAGS